MKSLIAPEEDSQSSNNVGLDVEESFLDNLLTYAREEGDNGLKKRPECARCRFDIDSLQAQDILKFSYTARFCYSS